MQSSTGVRFETVFLSKNAPGDDKIDQLIYWCKRFDKLNLAPKSAGNLSTRTKKGFVITATGVALRDAERDNLVEVVDVKTAEDKIEVYVKGRAVPSKESVLHSEIYHSRPDINAVFHVHDELVVGLADELDLPCTEGEQPRGSYELTSEVQRVLGLRKDARYLVLRNHGVIAMGETLAEAGRLVENTNSITRNLTRRKGAKKMQATPEFESNAVGILKREIWEASDAEIDSFLKDYDIPSGGEMDRPASYVQTTLPGIQAKKLEKNDIVLVPLGSTELHGDNSVLAQDTLQATRICEALRRYTAKQGKEVSIALPPWIYGNHPKHHAGIIGTIPVSQSTLLHLLVDVMFGLWAQGLRKFIFVNNHAQHWVITAAMDEFGLRYPELPYYSVAFDWCSAVWEFFQKGVCFEDDFIHADEPEASLMLLLAPEMMDMSKAVDTTPRGYLPSGHFNKSANQQVHRPNLWYSVRNNVPLEFVATPQGVVGSPTKASAEKAKRPVVAALRYLTLLIDDILATFPPGVLPPIEEVTLYKEEEIEGYLKKPGEPGYRNPYRIWRPY